MDRSLQLLIRFGYDGGRFHGVQPQPGFATAGGALLCRVADAFGDVEVRAVSFCARTDAGVHADVNYASCRVARAPHWSDAYIAQTLASLDAPRDDGLHDVQATRCLRRTMARGIAREKHYRYVIEAQRAEPAPAEEARAWQVVPALDAARMQRGANALIGTHDFSAYTCRSASGSRVKTVHRINVQSSADARIVVDVHGAGFLRYMVRYIVGHLAAIGAGLEPVIATEQRLQSRALPSRVLRAPAGGLRLVNVSIEALDG